MTSTEFWELKHKIDEEVKRLGWSTAKCRAFTMKHYGKDSRLKMTNAQLKRLLESLRRLASSQSTRRKLRNRKKKG